MNVLIETLEAFVPKLSAVSLPDPGEFPIEARLVFMELENEACYFGTGVYADFKGDLRRWRENACRLA